MKCTSEWRVSFHKLSLLVQTIHLLWTKIKFLLTTNLNSSIQYKNTEMISSFRLIGFDHPILCEGLPLSTHPNYYLCHIFIVFRMTAKAKETYQRFKVTIISIHGVQETRCHLGSSAMTFDMLCQIKCASRHRNESLRGFTSSVRNQAVPTETIIYVMTLWSYERMNILYIFFFIREIVQSFLQPTSDYKDCFTNYQKARASGTELAV